MIVLDASVLIAQLDAEDAHHGRASALLLGAARAGQLDRATGALRQLKVKSVRLDEDAPMRLAALRADTRLRLPDCCVLLAAEQADGGVATFDDRLAGVARERGFVVRGR
ncbi:MAG: type II toxin-antitoxin system VapC family toxin [Egibacteraceae bacterium]